MKWQIQFFAITLVLPIVGFCQNNFSVGGNSLTLESQSISIGIGPIYTLTNQSVRMINSKDDFQNTASQIKITYEQYFVKKQLSLFSSLSKFEGHTWIKFNKGSVIAKDGFPTLGVGYYGVNLLRFDFGMNYSILDLQNNYYLKPQIAIGILKSISNGEEIYSELFEIKGPDYYQLELISAETYNNIQVIPVIGLSTGIVLWKKFELNLNIQGVLGLKAFQKMFFKYSYKGAPQETAVFEGRGTGIYTSLGIGYRFKKAGKKKTGD